MGQWVGGDELVSLLLGESGGGGVPNSQHVLGWAADVYPVNGKISEFQTWIDLRWSGGLGYGARKGFVHLDARDGFPCFGGRKRGIRWIY